MYVAVLVLRALAVLRCQGANSLGAGQYAAEEEVLYDGKFVKNFSLVHLDHAGVDFLPSLDGGDVVQHGGMPAQRCSLDLK